jgi:hypothetical protein
MITYIIIYLVLVLFGLGMAKFCNEPAMFWVSLVPVFNLLLVGVAFTALIHTAGGEINNWIKK